MDPTRALFPRALEVKDEWGSSGPKVTDVQAFGSADPHPPVQWLVYVTEQRIPRLSFANQAQQRLTADLKSTRDNIEGEFGNRRRYVGAKNVHPG